MVSEDQGKGGGRGGDGIEEQEEEKEEEREAVRNKERRRVTGEKDKGGRWGGGGGLSAFDFKSLRQRHSGAECCSTCAGNPRCQRQPRDGEDEGGEIKTGM